MGAHVSHAALVKAGFKMWQVSGESATCGKVAIPISGQQGQDCILAAAFSPDWNNPPQKAAASIIVINKCADKQITVDASELLPLGTSKYHYNVFKYKSEDGGWAELPEDPTSFPWPQGPLFPNHKSEDATGKPTVTIKVPSISLTVIHVKPK